MGIAPENVPNHVKSLMSDKDRKGLGKWSVTAGEAQRRFMAGQEKDLQKLIAQFLSVNEIYFETDRMDKRTTGKLGRPDFRICYRGRWIGVECKAEGGKLRPEQEKTLEAIRKSGGITIVAFGLKAVMDELRKLDATTERRAGT